MYIKSLQINNYFFHNKIKNNNISTTLNDNRETIDNIKNEELKNKINQLKKIEITEEKSIYIVNDMLKDEMHFLNELSSHIEGLKKSLEDYVNPQTTNEPKIDSKTGELVHSLSFSKEGKEIFFKAGLKSLSTMVHIYSGITSGFADFYGINNSIVVNKIKEVLTNSNNDESLFNIGYTSLGLEGLDDLDLTKPDDLMKKFDNSLELINKKREKVKRTYSYLNTTYSKILDSCKNKSYLNNEPRYINEII